jgi:hypothetical protein
MDWRGAAERMNRLRIQGEQWTSYSKMAEQIGCSKATIFKAVKQISELQTWAKPQTTSAPRAQSINDVVTDHAAQRRELDPADDAAIREYLERDLSPDERAFFNGLSKVDQIFFLSDPDKHPRILGRKP